MLNKQTLKNYLYIVQTTKVIKRSTDLGKKTTFFAIRQNVCLNMSI